MAVCVWCQKCFGWLARRKCTELAFCHKTLNERPSATNYDWFLAMLSIKRFKQIVSKRKAIRIFRRSTLSKCATTFICAGDGGWKMRISCRWPKDEKKNKMAHKMVIVNVTIHFNAESFRISFSSICSLDFTLNYRADQWKRFEWQYLCVNFEIYLHSL